MTEPETLTDFEVLEEAVLSVFVAFARQLDLDQLLIDLLHQRETGMRAWRDLGAEVVEVEAHAMRPLRIPHALAIHRTRQGAARIE